MLRFLLSFVWQGLGARLNTYRLLFWLIVGLHDLAALIY